MAAKKLFERLLEQRSFCTRLVNELPQTKVSNASTPTLPGKSYFAPSSRLSPGGKDPFGSKVCNGPLRKKNSDKNVRDEPEITTLHETNSKNFAPEKWAVSRPNPKKATSNYSIPTSNPTIHF